MTISTDIGAMTDRLRQVALRVSGRDGGEAPQIDGLRRLSGGASLETWRFTAVLSGVGLELVLRRAPGATATTGLDLRAGLRTEAQLLGLAAKQGVPVPHVWAMLEPGDGLGEGFIMEFIEGETLGGRIVREPGLADARKVLAYQCGAAMAAIHGIPRDKLPPLREGSPAAEVESYVTSYRNSGQHKPVFELTLQWLRANLPKTAEPLVLVHGDFRNGNLMVDQAGLRAVLDWELAHLGDPMEDLGWICVNSWRFGGPLPVGGFGTREDLFAGYASVGGVVDEKRVRFWEVLGVLKWGIACETMSRAPIDGRALAVERAVIGRRSSETEIDLLNLLAPRGGLCNA